jgi:hypothetical protein
VIGEPCPLTGRPGYGPNFAPATDPSRRDVLLTLRTFRCHGGGIFPAHATLAECTSLSAKTVERALHAARDLGLVTWSERRVRRGWRWLRTSNLYRLVVPDAPLQTGLRRRRRTNRPAVERGESGSKKEALRTMFREAAAMPDLLARRRQAFEGRFA